MSEIQFDMPDKPLVVLRTFIGDRRVDEIGRTAHVLGKGLSTEECVCFAEYFRLMAWVRATREEHAARTEVLGGEDAA